MFEDITQNPDFNVLRRGLVHQVALSPEKHNEMLTSLKSGDVRRALPWHEVDLRIIEQYKQAHTNLQKKFAACEDPDFQGWLAYKDREIAVLDAIAKLQQTKDAQEFIGASTSFYGSYDNALFADLVQIVLKRVKELNKDAALIADIPNFLGAVPDRQEALHTPNEAEFNQCKSFLEKYFANLLKEVEASSENMVSSIEILRQIERLLRVSEADKLGWKVKTRPQAAKVSVNAYSKRIYVAEKDFYLSTSRIRGLMLHEIGVHVGRRLQKKGFAAYVPIQSNSQLAHEEGMGVLVEQLSLKEFHLLRMYRYIAVGFALGADGVIRNAREVYEIIWRLRYLSTPYADIEKAKQFSAEEVVKIFRGIAPDVAGAVLMREKLYAEGNNAWWGKLLAGPLSYGHFKNLLEK